MYNIIICYTVIHGGGDVAENRARGEKAYNMYNRITSGTNIVTTYVKALYEGV